MVLRLTTGQAAAVAHLAQHLELRQETAALACRLMRGLATQAREKATAVAEGPGKQRHRAAAAVLYAAASETPMTKMARRQASAQPATR